MVMPKWCLPQYAAYWYNLLTALRTRKIKFAIVGFVKVRNKAVNTSNSIFEENISLRATGRILELLRPFVLLLRHGYCLLKDIKSKREFVIFQDNK